VSNAAVHFHERFAAWAEYPYMYSTTDIAKHDSKSSRSVSGWLSELAGVGAVEQITTPKGNIAATWQLRERDTSRVRGMIVPLPKAEDLR